MSDTLQENATLKPMPVPRRLVVLILSSTVILPRLSGSSGEEYQVAVRMRVDEPRSDDLAGRVDASRRSRIAEPADGNDPVPAQSDVGPHPRPAAAVQIHGQRPDADQAEARVEVNADDVGEAQSHGQRIALIARPPPLLRAAEQRRR